MSAPIDITKKGATALYSALDKLVQGTDIEAELKDKKLNFVENDAKKALEEADEEAAKDRHHIGKRMKLLKSYTVYRDARHARLTRSKIFAFGAHSAYRVAYEHARLARKIES
jgi:hypothetical protein